MNTNEAYLKRLESSKSGLIWISNVALFFEMLMISKKQTESMSRILLLCNACYLGFIIPMVTRQSSSQLLSVLSVAKISTVKFGSCMGTLRSS